MCPKCCLVFWITFLMASKVSTGLQKVLAFRPVELSWRREHRRSRRQVGQSPVDGGCEVIAEESVSELGEQVAPASDERGNLGGDSDSGVRLVPHTKRGGALRKTLSKSFRKGSARNQERNSGEVFQQDTSVEDAAG